MFAKKRQGPKYKNKKILNFNFNPNTLIFMNELTLNLTIFGSSLYYKKRLLQQRILLIQKENRGKKKDATIKTRAISIT